MRENIKCPIWSTKAEVKDRKQNGATGYVIVDSSRAGGEYKISQILIAELGQCEDASFKVRLTSWLIEQRKLGERCPEITNSVFEDVQKRQLLTVSERADRLLQYGFSRNFTFGKLCEVPDSQ